MLLLGPIHAKPEKFENPGLFLWLRLSSTLDSHEKGAFRKRSSSPNAGFLFLLDGINFENEALRKRWRHDNQAISLTEFFCSNTN